MGLTPLLNPLTVPQGTEFPGTVQDFLSLIAEYMEITGLEDFNGVNYGSTEPAPENRDKAWFKTDGSGVPLGWYTWNGSAWVVLPAKAIVGDVAARDAISNPQDGTLFQVIGTGLYVYDAGLGQWEASFPAAQAQQVYERMYLFPSQQQLATASAAVPSWNSIDLTSYLTSAGITDFKGVMVRIECGFPDQGFGGGPILFETTLRVTQDNTNSTSANNVTKCTARQVRDDGRVAAYADNFGIMPKGTGNDLYYSFFVTNASGATANIWLTGFIY
jgi:hypothetical protein